MARILAFLVAFVMLVYGAWPYYSIYRLDQALSDEDSAALAPYVDLPAIQARYKSQLSQGMDTAISQQDREAAPVLNWIARSIQDLGGRALDQVITLDLVHSMLRQAAVRATDTRPAYFIAGIDYAFFSAWNRFEIRLGEGDRRTLITMSPHGTNWAVTDIAE